MNSGIPLFWIAPTLCIVVVSLARAELISNNVEEMKMQELTDKQIERQDYVDNTIFELMQTLNPTLKGIEWDIEVIAEVRDIIERYFVEQIKVCDQSTFYPYINK